jgi:predicted phage terminase large subunit-like protein
MGEETLAPTTEQVQDAIGWHTKNVMPLLNNPATDLNLVVGTRWYDQDLIRHILDKEPHYSVITRACRETDGEPDASGQLTYPERFDERTLERLAGSLGPYMFSCLYMNQPVRREDMAFKPEWFQDYDTLPPSQSFAIYTTVDPATDPKLSKSGKTDYSVVLTTGKDLITGFIYVLDYYRRKCNPGELCAAIFDQVTRWHPILVGYEDVAYQRSIDYYLKEQMRKSGQYFNLQPLKLSRQKDAKNTRIAGLQPLFSSGTVRTKYWMSDLKTELTMFPMGTHDDLADCLSMQLVLWKLTKIQSQKAQQFSDHPFSLESAMRSIKNRDRKNSVVFDPSRCSSLTFCGRTA